MRSVIASGVAAVALLAATMAVVVSSSPQASRSAELNGRTLFHTLGCIGCHHVTDKGLRSQIGIGPDLSALAQRAPVVRPNMSADAYIRESIRQPQAFVVSGFTTGSVQMPVLPVSDAELDALVAFLLN